MNELPEEILSQFPEHLRHLARRCPTCRKVFAPIDGDRSRCATCDRRAKADASLQRMAYGKTYED